MKRRSRWLFGLVAVFAVLGIAGCGGDDDEGSGGDGNEKVTLQLKWVTQAQFAGYYAALDQGYYEEEGLDVTIKPGGPDITNEQVVASGQATSASTGCLLCSRRATREDSSSTSPRSSPARQCSSWRGRTAAFPTSRI